MTEPIKGVAYVQPPAEILPAISNQIDEFLKGIPDGARGMFAVDITTERGINGALVARKDGAIDWAGALWVGKSWGEPVRGGVALRASW